MIWNAFFWTLFIDCYVLSVYLIFTLLPALKDAYA